MNQPKRNKSEKWRSDIKENKIYTTWDSLKSVMWKEIWSNEEQMFDVTGTSKETEEALKESANKIVQAAKSVLEETMPELSADIVTNGIVVTGGGALLSGIKELLEDELKVPIKVSDSPLTCVAEGTAIMLDNINLIDK